MRCLTPGYRINRKFISIKQLRKHAYKSDEKIIIRNGFIETPF